MNKDVMTGSVMTVAVVVISLAVCCAFTPLTFGTWVAFLVMACIPAQIVCALVWRCGYPAFAAALPQPLKGVVFTFISVAIGMVAAVLMWKFVGGGVAPTPPLIMFTIVTIAAAFWVVAVWQTWPVSLVAKHPLALGVGVLLLCYLGGYLVFSTLFDFSFLAGAPVYIEALDPKGLFNAWKIMSFIVTSVATIMLFILIGFWPVSSIPAAQNNPVIFSAIASGFILAVASIIFYLATSILKVDYVVYMVRGPVTFVFGAFVLLNLLKNSLFANLKQPQRSVFVVVTCVFIAVFMQILYEIVANVFVGPLASGAPTYDIELWIANAMLAMTFPVIVAATDFLEHWPFNARVENETFEPVAQAE